MKKYIKMNNNNNHLSLGNFCRIIKEQSLNKSFANQVDIFCTILNIESINESTINNYCLGARAIGTTYKEQYQNYKKKYQQNKKTMLPIILNLTSILDGYIYTMEYEKISFLNQNLQLQKLCYNLYNIAKNDSTVSKKFIETLKHLLKKNTYFECICELIFYIILEKKQPIYIENIITETISNILTHTNISLNDLEKFLKLQFNDGTNYIYSLKQLANNNNPYACFELGYLEYKGEITKTPRYNKCYEYLKIAANYNHPRANYLIAKLLLDKKIGTLSKEDKLLALNYLKTAVNLGSIAALNSIGLYSLNEEKDEEQAISYFKKAISQNYIYSYNNLGKIYETKKDYQQAFQYYEKSANLEECWACNKLGEYYRLGIGTNKNLKKAYYYYNLALEFPINQACNWAKYNLAKYFYLEGNYKANIEKNETKAISLLTESSENNLLESSIELLYYYSDKYFTTKNKSTLQFINYLINKIETHPNYQENHKKTIETIIKKIKEKKKINQNLFND